MSGVLKRSHDDGSHSSSSYKYPHEDSSSYPNTPFEVGQDMRFGKIVRTESREADRRSPLHPMYRMPSSMSDSHINHTVAGSENRVELSRDLKENRESMVENRETKNERELFHQSAKIEKDGRFEGRREDNKEVKYDRETHNDSKRDVKIEKDGYGVVSSHSNWKEHLRGKRYPDPLSTTGNVDSWVNLRANLQGSVDMGKDCLKINDREYVEANEAVGENKVDLKGDDKYKDRDRKRKEGKHRDWVDKEKDRNDRRNSLQVGSGSNDYKESIREEREAERWERERERERERRDAQKDKERPKEREKDFVSWEVCNELEKEGAHNEKEILGQTSEQENLSSEQKKLTDFEAWKNVVREARDRKKERERDVEAERPEKRSRCYDKESDGGADVDGTIEREREAFGYGVQQRKRMLRPRGSPQVANSEARFRSRAQDADGSQGKPEVSTVVYKVGECMHELIKLWKEHEASRPEEDCESSHNGPTLEIRIPAEHLTATNRQVRGGQLWGTDIYTNDSDIVAVLMHTGYCRPTASPPPSAIQELRTTIRVLPPQDCYVSTLRNNVRSRAWGAAIGCSYRVEHCCIVKKGGGTIDLEPCLTHTSTVEPTLAPVAVERTMTTRAAALGNSDSCSQLEGVLHRKGQLAPDEVALLVTSLKALSGAVSYIDDVYHQSLLGSIFGMSMWNYGPDVMDALADLIISLAASSGKYVDVCLEMLVSNFIPPQLDMLKQPRCVAKKEQVMCRVHSAFKDIADLVPLAPSRLLPIIIHKMPNIFTKEPLMAIFVENMLRLEASAVGELVGRRTLIMAVVDRLIDLDVEIGWDDILSEEPTKGIFEMELEDEATAAEEDGIEFPRESLTRKSLGGNVVVDKLDSLMVLTFEHLKSCEISGRLVEVFEYLLQSFQVTVLNVYKSKFAQFVMFYACSLDPENCGVRFAKLLANIFVCSDSPQLTRMSAVAYLASYLARGRFLSTSFVTSMLERLVQWCSEYCQLQNGDVNPKAHKVFYAGCQALMYVLCFRMRSVMDIPRLKSQLFLMPLGQILKNSFDPLKVCLPSIVEEFVGQAKAAHLLDESGTIIFSDVLESELSKAFGGIERLDMFFPFDPCLLKKCDSFIRPNFVYWSMVRTTYDIDDDGGYDDYSDDDIADQCADFCVGESLEIDVAESFEEHDYPDEFNHALNKMSITPKDSLHWSVGREKLHPPMQMPSKIRPSTSPESL